MTSTAIADMPARQRRPQPYPDAERPRYELRQPLVALALTLPAALLLYLCFFPVAWGWLAWGALVPLLLLARSRMRPVTIYTFALLAGLAFYWPVLQWMRVADAAMYYAWGFLATYCALYFPVALFFIRYLDRRTPLPLVVSAPVVWTALEYLRCEFGTGFSWYLLGHTQHDQLHVIQIADLAGAFGVSFLVVTVNAVLAEALWLHPAVRRLIEGKDTPPRTMRYKLLIQVSVVGTLLLAACAYGDYRLHQNTFGYGPRIALIQGNLDQRVRNDESMAQVTFNHYRDLCDEAERNGGESLDLIVWPETSSPLVWWEDAPGVPSEFSAEEAAQYSQRWPTPLLLGLKSSLLDRHGKRAEYNTALLLDHGQALDHYDKIHLVPLGEYVPFRQTFPLMKKLSPYDFDYSIDSGHQHTRFAIQDKWQKHHYTFGVVICYEDTDPDVVRPYGGGDGKPAADFILNTSNDGWFNGTSEHDQHLAVARFRAVECRRAVARSVNMGISAVIDPNGRVLAPRQLQPVQWPPRDKPTAPIYRWAIDQADWGHELPVSRWGEFKKVQGLLYVALPIDERTSFYARAGDWLPWTCWSALAVGLFTGMIRRLRRAPLAA